MTHAVPRRPILAALALLAALAAPAMAEPPPEGRCPDVGGGAAGLRSDGGDSLLREGDVLRLENLLSLAQLFPDEVWSFREAFFYEGMRMEIGSCHRRYPVADFYREATERFAARAKLDEDGNLAGYVAGLPFPPESIAPGDPEAGVKWAWNFQHRYRGAGPVGRFRIVDLSGAARPRPDLRRRVLLRRRRAIAPTSSPSGYATPESKDSLFVAGGRFFEPFNARHLAWRQIRQGEVRPPLAGARRHLRLRAGDAEAAARRVGLDRRALHAPLHGDGRVRRRAGPDRRAARPTATRSSTPSSRPPA